MYCAGVWQGGCESSLGGGSGEGVAEREISMKASRPRARAASGAWDLLLSCKKLLTLFIDIMLFNGSCAVCLSVCTPCVPLGTPKLQPPSPIPLHTLLPQPSPYPPPR